MAEDKANVAIKFDKDKLKFNLIPPEVEKALAEVLTMGAAKYGDRNWEKGLDEGRILASLRRHLNAYQLGEKTDPESGYSHLKHALCNAAFLVTMEERQKITPYTKSFKSPTILDGKLKADSLFWSKINRVVVARDDGFTFINDYSEPYTHAFRLLGWDVINRTSLSDIDLEVKLREQPSAGRYFTVENEQALNRLYKLLGG